jgi:cytochrome c oxidase subunit III
MNARPALDVSPLPTFAFGKRSVLWWTTAGLFIIEGMGFALLVATYIYLRWRETDWPPGVESPDLLWGTANLVVMIVSGWPNHLAKKAAERLDRGAVQLWLSICLLFSIVFLAIRALEFSTLNVWWDTNAYGSIVWFLLGMHTAHVVTDLVESTTLVAIAFLAPLDGSRFVDFSENADYWYFIVGSWVPIYGLIYLAPRIF